MSEFGPSSNKMDTSTIDKMRETSRRGLHAKFKREYNTPVSCKACKRFHVVSQVTIGYCCPYCGKYQNVGEATKRYEKGDVEYPESKNSKINMPAIKSSEKREYSKFRDEHEIRAEWFINGKTRDNMGVQKFERELKRELKKNKCYRGDASNVG